MKYTLGYFVGVIGLSVMLAVDSPFWLELIVVMIIYIVGNLIAERIEEK